MPRLNILVQKTVIIRSEIFNKKVCSLHDDVSTEDITMFT